MQHSYVLTLPVVKDGLPRAACVRAIAATRIIIG